MRSQQARRRFLRQCGAARLLRHRWRAVLAERAAHRAQAAITLQRWSIIFSCAGCCAVYVCHEACISFRRYHLKISFQMIHLYVLVVASKAYTCACGSCMHVSTTGLFYLRVHQAAWGAAPRCESLNMVPDTVAPVHHAQPDIMRHLLCQT